jgi:hypothetical protein
MFALLLVVPTSGTERYKALDLGFDIVLEDIREAGWAVVRWRLMARKCPGDRGVEALGW